MKVVSTLADIEFRFGRIERRGGRLVIHSHVDQAMKTTVFVAPRDVFIVIGRMLVSPGAWLFVLGLPIFYLLERRPARPRGRPSGRGGGWGPPSEH